MSQKLPDKVRAGDKLSAAWMNGVVDYLKYLNDQQLRRRLLKGVGYKVTESSGGSSLTIDRQAIVRVLSDDLDVMRNEDYELRIKPKGLCEVEPDSGNWDKIIQVHTGRVTDKRGNSLTVTRAEGSSTSASPDGAAPWDAADWVDLAVLESLGEEGSAEEVSVYVKLTLEASRAVDGVFVVRTGGSDVDGESEDNAPEGSTLLIPIGSVSGANIEGTPRYYITQYQQGPIDLVPLAQYKGEQGEGSDVDAAPEGSSVDEYPGLIAAARAETKEESTGSAHWLISAGELIVPLAHAPLPPTELDAEAEKPRAGLILGLATAPSVEGSNVDGESAPRGLWYIENGILYHPELGLVELCRYFDPSGEADRDGSIRSIGSHASGWSIAEGDIRIPLAQQDGRDESGWNGEGLITRAGWLPDGESVPRVSQGQVLFPRVGTGTEREPLANYNNAPVANNIGTVRGIEFRADIDSPRIADGMVQLVEPSGSDVDDESIVYEFDPAWFVVDGTAVSINTAALDELVAEAVDELSVNVTASGVLTSTEFGDIEFATSTTDASLANLSLDTNVAY